MCWSCATAESENCRLEETFVWDIFIFLVNSNTINALLQQQPKKKTSFSSASYTYQLTDKCGETLLPLRDAHWTKGWGEEQMKRWWWFPRILYSRCRSGVSADSWRCPQRTSGAGRRWLVFQRGSRGCYKRDFFLKKKKKDIRWMPVNSLGITLEVSCVHSYLWEVCPMYPTKYFCLTTR